MSASPFRLTPASLLIVFVCLLIPAFAGCGGDDSTTTTARTTEERPAGEARPERDREAGLARTQGSPRLQTLATGLEVPWEIAFLPDGSALLTERPGRVRLISAQGDLRDEPVAEIPVAAIGEGGLLGLALDPEFQRNDFVYLYETTDSGNQVVRYRYRDRELVEQATVLDGIAAAPIHDGGRIRFGPDDRLYVTTGDTGQPALAQDAGSLNGKILALEPDDYRGDGGDPQVVSRGHRNPQGLDWHPRSGRLYVDEHGPDCCDEVNLIREGQNYGWPHAVGSEHEGFAAPLAVFEDSIAPAGGSFVTLPGSRWSGDYLIGALIGEQIRRLRLEGSEVTADEALFEGELGRVRTVVEGPDGALYALTSNRDGRGSPTAEDDRIVRIVPPAAR